MQPQKQLRGRSARAKVRIKPKDTMRTMRHASAPWLKPIFEMNWRLKLNVFVLWRDYLLEFEVRLVSVFSDMVAENA